MRKLQMIVGCLLATAACESEQSLGDSTCEQALAKLSACYPGLAGANARCTEQTLANLESLPDTDCASVEASKADWLAIIGGCGADEHVCGGFFCCKNYHINWSPSTDAEWDIEAPIEAFEGQAPAEIVARLDFATEGELYGVVSEAFVQTVGGFEGTEAAELAVEMTRGLVPVPYAEFIRKLPAENWGRNLAHYLGGEVKVYSRDAGVTRQVERMVLSPLLDLESNLTNNDMTKVEVIFTEQDRARVFWRVRFSDNDSTQIDVGSVEFSAYGSDATLVKFHSAHRVKIAGIKLTLAMLKHSLRETFSDFVRHYRELAEAK